MRTPLGYEEELARRGGEALAERLHDIPARTLSRLALLPEWTRALAERAGLGDPVALVDRLEHIGLVERRQVLGPGGTRDEAFWVRASRRRELAGYLRAARGEELVGDLESLVAAVVSPAPSSGASRGGSSGVASPGVASPAGAQGLGPWHAVVTRHREDPSGLSMIREVDDLIERDRLGDAVRLVAAAQIVGDVIGGPLTDSARRAQWRIDRANRTAEDVHHLRHYHSRADVERTLDDLVYGPPGTEWGLHLLGEAGVGKTMVIRYLAAGRFAADRGRERFAVARADFDHLDPRYPEIRPAEVLLALAGELLGFGGTRAAEYTYRRFHDAANELHEELARADRDPARGEDLLRAAVVAFARFAGELPAPVVLILDTCEELAKLHTPGSASPAIDRTFQVLELLHDAAPSVRVVLAGRRWLVPPPDDLQRASGPVLRPRPYLRVVTVGGFTRDEATRYLDRRAAGYREEDPEAAADPLPAVVVEALLHRAARHDRYSPFELACYCEWALSEPDQDAAEFAVQLRTAPGDPYVERRLVGRLADENVQGALAVAAQLGRFDIELIRPALTRAGLDAQAAFDGLAAQEWVAVRAIGTDGRPRVIEVDEHLRDRIRAVTAAAPDRYPLDLPGLGRDAAELVDRTRLADVSAETVEAAVRLLPADEAGRLWRRLEERVVEADEWAWAAQISARAGAAELPRAESESAEAEAGSGSGSGSGSEAGSEAGRGSMRGSGRGSGRGPTILAAIIATQAAARVHTGQRHDLAGLWENVENYAPRHPDETERGRLALRAQLGGLAAAGPESAPRASLLLLPPHLLAEAEAVGSVAAMLERLPPLQGVPITSLDIATRASTDQEAGTAVVRLYESAVALGGGEPERAADLADQAIEAAIQGGGRRWADWVPPRRLVDRCRLGRLLVAFVRGAGFESIPWRGWRDEALDRLDDIDAERLVALCVRFELGHRPVPAEVLTSIQSGERYVAGRRPYAWLHHQTGPLVVELAEAWRVLGEPDRARDLLRDRVDVAVAAGDDPDTIEECQLALLRLCRRYRTLEYFAGINRVSQTGSPRERAEAWLVRTLVNGDAPGSPEQAGSWHGWWRCQSLRSLRERPPRWAPPEAEPGIPVADTLADAREFAELYPGFGVARTREFGTAADPISFDPEHAIRLGDDRHPFAPGARGRALLEVEEVRALRFPGTSARSLGRAVLPLMDAGDRLAAGQAGVLATLADWRDGGYSGLPVGPYRDLPPFVGETTSGWSDRVAAVELLLAGGIPPVQSPPESSPELRGLGDRPVPRPLPSPEIGYAVPGPGGALPPQPPPPYAEPGSDVTGGLRTGGGGLGGGSLGGGGLGGGGLGGGAAGYGSGPGGGSGGLGSSYGSGAGAAMGRARGRRRGRYEDEDEDNEEERERTSWLAEDDDDLDLWVEDDAAVPPIIGAAPPDPPLRAPGSPPLQGPPPAAPRQGPVVPPPVPAGYGQQPAAPGPRRPQQAQRLRRSISVNPRALLFFALIAAGISYPAYREFVHLLGHASAAVPTVVGAGLFIMVSMVICAYLVARIIGGKPDPSLTVKALTGPLPLVVERVHRSPLVLDEGWVARLVRMAPIWPSFRNPTGVFISGIDVRRRTTVRLSNDGGIAGQRWERLLAEASTGSPDRMLLCFRGYPSLPWRKEPRRLGLIYYLGPSHMARTEPYVPDLLGSRVVVHLLGSPVSTAGGWRLRVRPTVSGAKGPGTEEDVLFGPHDLVGPGVTLIVLQAEPVDGPPEALGELHDGFAELAEESLEAGANAVLVIPPLPDFLSGAAGERIDSAVKAQRLWRGRWRPFRPTALLRLLAALKTMVADVEDTAGSERHAARDVLLFMRTKPEDQWRIG